MLIYLFTSLGTFPLVQSLIFSLGLPKHSFQHPIYKVIFNEHFLGTNQSIGDKERIKPHFCPMVLTF